MKGKTLTGILVACAALSMIPFNNTFAAEPKAIYRIDDAELVASQLNYEYYPESLYNVDCQVGYITDIVLKPGDNVTHIAAGDTAQWMLIQQLLGTLHIFM